MQKRWNPGDRENVDFEVGGPVLEDLKPGLHYEKEKEETSQDDHRFKRSARKDVPKGSLAERIRKATKQG